MIPHLHIWTFGGLVGQMVEISKNRRMDFGLGG